MFLRSVALPEAGETFPFDLPVLREAPRLALDAPVTMLVGENGSGKSTILEAVAWAAELPMAGSVERLDADRSLAHVGPLGDALQLSWERKTRRGFFLRAEDFFGYVKAQNAMKLELRTDAERIRRENRHLPEKELQRILGPYMGSVAATDARYGGDLDGRSHGESFIAFFKGRITGPGLYLLDEPEAALSPLRQLAFLTLIADAVARGAQFLIATHAPILMACPHARIYALDGERIAPTEFDDVEHVQILRSFLASPEAYLRHIVPAQEGDAP